MSAVKIFTCEGSLTFLEAPQRFTFRVFADSSLSVDVEPLDASRDANSAATEAGVADANDAAGQHGDVAMELQSDEFEGVNGEATGAVADAAGQENAAKVFAYDGRALPGRSDASERKQKAGARPRECFIVHFKLVRWCRDPYSTQFIKVVGRLSSKRGLSGKCIDLENAMEEDAEGEDFKLRLAPPPALGYRVEAVESPMFPLTPGLYVLSGHTIGENGYVYECEVRLKLKRDGRAVGASRELLYPQECVLAGSWTRDHVNYLLQYHMHDNRCTYMYFGSPFADGLRGSWQNADLSAFRSRAERGCLEFRLVEATRVWSAAYHKDYPDHFRYCVKLLLLAAMRAAPGSPRALPSHLVLHILAYFGYDWFRQPVLGDGANAEGEACRAMEVE